MTIGPLLIWSDLIDLMQSGLCVPSVTPCVPVNPCTLVLDVFLCPLCCSSPQSPLLRRQDKAIEGSPRLARVFSFNSIHLDSFGFDSISWEFFFGNIWQYYFGTLWVCLAVASGLFRVSFRVPFLFVNCLSLLCTVPAICSPVLDVWILTIGNGSWRVVAECVCMHVHCLYCCRLFCPLGFLVWCVCVPFFLSFFLVFFSSGERSQKSQIHSWREKEELGRREKKPGPHWLLWTAIVYVPHTLLSESSAPYYLVWICLQQVFLLLTSWSRWSVYVLWHSFSLLLCSF